MNIVKATKKYEDWLRRADPHCEPDLRFKHEQMAQGLFPFFRATFYRWMQVWPEVCPEWTARRIFFRWAICTSRTSAPGGTPTGGWCGV